MYHYVRPLKLTRFPKIKGLDLALFEEQLAYLAEALFPDLDGELIDAIEGSGRTSAAPGLLTFDDGYTDHYEHVFPRLAERRLQGSFFPVACSALDRQDPRRQQDPVHAGLERRSRPACRFIEDACRERRRRNSACTTSRTTAKISGSAISWIPPTSTTSS